jgi:ABC-type microcin C transport system permease subunit YejE
VFDFLFDNSQLAAGRMVRIFSVICSSFLLGAITGSFMTQRLQNKTLWIVSLMLAFLWVRLIPSTRGKTSAFINELGDAAKPMRAVSRSSVETTCRHLLERRRRITTTIKEHPLWQR